MDYLQQKQNDGMLRKEFSLCQKSGPPQFPSLHQNFTLATPFAFTLFFFCIFALKFKRKIIWKSTYIPGNLERCWPLLEKGNRLIFLNYLSSQYTVHRRRKVLRRRGGVLMGTYPVILLHSEMPFLILLGSLFPFLGLWCSTVLISYICQFQDLQNPLIVTKPAIINVGCKLNCFAGLPSCHPYPSPEYNVQNNTNTEAASKSEQDSTTTSTYSIQLQVVKSSSSSSYWRFLQTRETYID